MDFEALQMFSFARFGGKNISEIAIFIQLVPASHQEIIKVYFPP
jgi:hypothetical protein